MKTYILDIIPKIQRFSQKLDNLTILLNKHWVILDEDTSRKSVFIFREKDNQLLISNDGEIEKGNWEYLGNNSLLIDRKDGSFLFKHGFIDDYVLALKVDGKKEYALLVNEQWFEKELKSLDKILYFLNERYIDQQHDISIPKHLEENVSNEINDKKRIVKFIGYSGEFKIYTNKKVGYEIGDFIKIDNKIPNDGKIKTGIWDYMIVKNGKITKIKK
ncbi:hypothetical protein F6U93_01840 [Tamlana haliotis]|uniref:Uncharacterized protein n=1 Tax=Pseudotamlana haliotis TaxID=2614804 RepID=A0A6N6MJ93_9FLAO|nr:hypothetical protein [Tamlana haliotis]KAB1070527.1 hypothetical protein F6U93_01840 [Tamlana haliotis]